MNKMKTIIFSLNPKLTETEVEIQCGCDPNEFWNSRIFKDFIITFQSSM